MSEEKEVLNEESLRKTYELKLNIDIASRFVLKNLIVEYKKVQQFVADKAMHDILLKLRLIPEKEITSGKCLKCYNPKKPKEKNLKWKWLNEKSETELNCGCLLSHFSLRKIFLPSRNYKVHPDWDMRLSGKLYFSNNKLVAGIDDGMKYNRELYDYCLKKTSETIRSQLAINKKLDKLIEKESVFYSLLDKSKRAGYISDDLKEKGIVALSMLNARMKRQEQKINRLEKRRASDIQFHTNTIRFPPRYCFVAKVNEEYKIVFKYLSKEPLIVDFFGKDRSDVDINALFNQEIKPELDLTFKRGDYYIQYIYRISVKNSIPEKNMMPVGISFGLKNSACAVSLNNLVSTKTKVKFWNGRPLVRHARQFFKINKIWQKRKDKPKKDKSIRTKKQKKWYFSRVNAFSLLKHTNSETHKLSHNIVEYVKNTFDNPVICLQDLKNIEFYVKKIRIPLYKLSKTGKKIQSTQKFNNWLLKKWNYRMLASQIEYKARWEGIPVVYMKYYNACPICGEKNFKGFFNSIYKCESCCYEANERYVVASCIAKKYHNAEIKEIKGKWIEWSKAKNNSVKKQS